MDRRVRTPILVASLGLATLAAGTAAPNTALALIATDLAVGLTLSLAGFLAWQRRPRSAVGSLVAVTGLLWLLGSVLPAALYLHRVGLTALFLSYPTGKLARRSDQILVTASVALDGALPFVGQFDIATVGLAALASVMVVRRTMAATGPARRSSCRVQEPGGAPHRSWPARIRSACSCTTRRSSTTQGSSHRSRRPPA